MKDTKSPIDHRPTMPSATAFAVCMALAISLYGCAAGPDFRAPDPLRDATYVPGKKPTVTATAGGPGGEAQTFVDVESIGGAWWHDFGSTELDRLVQEALHQSPTLEQARLRLEQARHDHAAEAGATQWPQVDGSLNATREQQAATLAGAPAGSRSLPPFTLYQAQVNVSYTLDFFGGNRRALEALATQVDYQQFQLEAARLTLAGNVVTAAVRRASLEAQIELSERILDAQERQLAFAAQRFRAGAIAEADLLTQRTLVEQTRASLSPLRAQLAQAEHQLAVYLGRPPSQGAGALPTLDDLRLPTQMPLTVPAALARNRPDIRASEALLHQASANIGVATANLYPHITLTGSIGGTGSKINDLTSVWSLGSGLVQPLFNGGELRSRQQSAQDAFGAAYASYRQTVLQGLQQVADTLRALEHDADELAARDRAQRDAEAAAGFARRRFEAGGMSQLALIDIQRQELQTTLDRTRVQAQRLADSAALYQALGARP